MGGGGGGVAAQCSEGRNNYMNLAQKNTYTLLHRLTVCWFWVRNMYDVGRSDFTTSYLGQSRSI